MKNKQSILFGLGVGIGVAVVLLLVFFAGIYIGSKRNNSLPSSFPFWEKRFHVPGGFVPDKFGHGAVGAVDSIGNNTFIVKDRNGALKTVLVDDKTLIRLGHLAIKFSDLKKDDQVIVIGEAQEKEGAIVARVVRVMVRLPKDASGSGLPFFPPKMGIRQLES